MRVDYSKNNYCRTCRLLYPKDVLYCTDGNGCGMKIRQSPRGKSMYPATRSG